MDQGGPLDRVAVGIWIVLRSYLTSKLPHPVGHMENTLLVGDSVVKTKAIYREASSRLVTGFAAATAGYAEPQRDGSWCSRCVEDDPT